MERNALAKTGSMACSLSGYVETRDGGTLLFSILTNDFIIRVVRVNRIADLTVEFLANFTRK